MISELPALRESVRADDEAADLVSSFEGTIEGLPGSSRWAGCRAFLACCCCGLDCLVALLVVCADVDVAVAATGDHVVDMKTCSSLYVAEEGKVTVSCHKVSLSMANEGDADCSSNVVSECDGIVHVFMAAYPVSYG